MNSDNSDIRDLGEETHLAGDGGSGAGTEVPAGEAGQPGPAGSEDAAGAGQEYDEMRDKYLRLAAEFDNYRKRIDRERTGSRDRAQAEVVQGMLEPLDDLQRVADLDAESTTFEALLEGVQMVEKKIQRALAALGLEPLDAGGRPFDPELHEALMTAPTDNADEDDTVGEVFQTGYTFRGSLVRPARVQVRKHER